MTDDPASQPPPSPADKHPDDAGRGEVTLYALANVEGSMSERFIEILNSILIVAMHMNPMLVGLALGLKTLYDSVTDPIMAWITDNTRSRWGRRRPYVLFGGVSRALLMVLIIWLMPTGGHLTPNSVMEAQKFVSDAVSTVDRIHKAAVLAAGQLEQDADQPRQPVLAGLSQASGDLAQAVAAIVEHRPTLQAAQARELIAQSELAERRAIAAEQILRHVLGSAEMPRGQPAGRDQVRADAAQAYVAAGLQPLEDIFLIEPEPAPKPAVQQGMFQKIAVGLQVFSDPANADQRALFFYLVAALILFTTLSTIQSVPYFALGIELSPSYNGRTQVVVYRGVLNHIVGLIHPWLPVICFSVFFATALQGLFWIAVGSALVGIPCTVLMFFHTRERTQFVAHKAKDRPGFLRSIVQIGRNPQFLRIAGLYCMIGMTNGIFQQVGFFLNVYWVMGSAYSGAKLGAGVAMVAWVLGLFLLPAINWGCRRFQKHRILQLAIVWMAIGTALKWWCMDPEHPEYQFILPFFFSIGIASVFTILPTLMADVTDWDELDHGVRREGMFGAVMAFITKAIGTLTPILAGAVLVLAGFDPALEYKQNAATILNMRLMYSFIPAAMLLLALLLLWRYPLTRAKVGEIKEQLRLRHEAEGSQP